MMHGIFDDNYLNGLDYLLCDLSSGTKDENLTLMRLFKLIKPDGVLIVTRPNEYFIKPTENLINNIRNSNLRILGLIENMTESCFSLCSAKLDSEESLQVKKIAKNNQVFYLGGIQYNTV
jgi:ATP-binding protein involved in chromosome partitioning